MATMNNIIENYIYTHNVHYRNVAGQTGHKNQKSLQGSKNHTVSLPWPN